MRLLIPFVVVASACASDSATVQPTLPDVTAATFRAPPIDHPYLPLAPGSRWTYRAQTEDGVERTEIEVLAETVTIQGVTATVVHDSLYLDDVLVEDTRDWFAQDEAGNVWYLGEDTCAYVDGACDDHGGSWRWGDDGALPGLAMPAAPTVDGQPYYQEYYRGEAEDVGEVIAVGVTITVPAGTYDDCITTRDTSPLEPGVVEKKTYCRGVGDVLDEEEDVRVELQTMTAP